QYGPYSFTLHSVLPAFDNCLLFPEEVAQEFKIFKRPRNDLLRRSRGADTVRIVNHIGERVLQLWVSDFCYSRRNASYCNRFRKPLTSCSTEMRVQSKNTLSAVTLTAPRRWDSASK